MPEDILDDVKPELTESDVLKALDDDSDSVVDEEDVKDETPEPSESEDSDKDAEKEDSDEEDELKEAKLSEDEDLEFQDIPRRAEILKAFPELYKKFPGIERAMHREIQFTNEFATPAEAKHAKERLEVFSQVETDLFSGNLGRLLASVKQQDPKAFKKIGDGLLQTLNTVDKETLQNVGETINRHILVTAFNAGKESGDEDGQQLQLAAQILHKYLYGSTAVQGPKTVKAEETNPEAEKLNTQRQKFEEQRLSAAVNDVTTRTNTTIDKFVEKYIDPKGTMSDYVRSRAVKDVKEALDKDIGEDPRFKAHLDKLWRSAMQSDYNEDAKSAIRKAILNKTNGVLMSHIRNVRATVNKSMSGNPGRKRDKDRSESEPEKNRLTARPGKEKERSESRSQPKRAFSLSDVMKAIE